MKALLKWLLPLVLVGCAWGSISLDATSTSGAQTASFSWSHTVGSGSNTVLIVTVGCRGNVALCRGATVTYNSVSMTQIIQEEESGDGNESYLFYLVAPSTGTNTVSVTLGGTVTSAEGSAISLFGVNQSTPIDVHGGNNTIGSSRSVSLTTTVNNDWVISGYSCNQNWSSWGTSQTDIFHVNLAQGSSYKGPVSTGSDTETVNYTSSGQGDFAAAAIEPASGGAATCNGSMLLMGVGCQ